MDKRLLKCLSYLTEFKHTGNIEVYHSLLLKYCPKRLHFSRNGMIARTQLAILHFNAIINAEQAVTKDKTPRYKLQFSKVSQNYVVKPIKKIPEKKYIDDLMHLIVDTARNGTKLKLPEVPQVEQSCNKPSKEEVIRRHCTRFTATPVVTDKNT